MRLAPALLAATLALALQSAAHAWQSDFFTLSNGQKVRATDPSGARGKVNPDGSISYPDGTTVGVGAGDATTVTQPDGSTTSRPPPDSFELPNGQQVRATDPAGNRGKQNPDGSVTYPDGTSIGMGSKGETVVTRGDGTISTRDAPGKGPSGGGTDTAGSGWATLPNGERVPANGPDGQPGVLQPDGSIRYADGSSVSGPAGSPTTVTGPDGSQRDFRSAREASESLPGSTDAPMDLNAMKAASDRILQRAKKMAELERERDKCLKGDAGDQCRKDITDAIRQLERENKADAEQYFEQLQANGPRGGSGPKPR